MPKVLSGNYLKYILDFSLSKPSVPAAVKTLPSSPGLKLEDLPSKGLCRTVLESIAPVPEDLLSAATARMDEKTKPLGALGRLEDLAVRMALIQNTLSPAVRQKNLFVFAGDHGITEEGVSAYPSEVTAQMVENFLNGGAAINVLCRHHGISLKIVDMGVKKDFSPHPDLIIKKVARGTRNFALEPAMTREQVIAALENGMSTFLEAYEKTPMDIVGLGEMGIGNTTSASALISVITGISPAEAAGRGTGVDDKGLAHKIEVIERVLAFHTLDPANGFEILQKIGGFEIAGIAGAILAAASKKTAIVLDGVISTAAGLLAYLIHPAVQGYLISGHRSVEKAQKAALDHMNLLPLIDFDMRLGEGTGAALAMDIIDASCKILCEMASFDEAKVARSSMNCQATLPTFSDRIPKKS
jgi:nicotinate-nucleotide--dimethylbenzimidazole phosphoribosyltransferase